MRPPRDYISEPPYFVAYEWPDNHMESWSIPTLREAMAKFWQDGHLSQPSHRVISDSWGLTILVEYLPRRYYFFATRECWDLCGEIVGPNDKRLRRLRAEEERINDD